MLQCTVTTKQSKIIVFFDYVVFVIVTGQNRNCD